MIDDILEIFVAPSKVFERRRDSGYGKLLLVLIVITLIISVATIGLTRPFWEAQFNMSMVQAEQNGAPALEGPARDAARTATVWFGGVGTAVLIPVFVWIGGLFVLIGSRVAGAAVSYKQGALIFTLAGFPRLISPLAMAVQGLLMDSTSIRAATDASLGPARFLDPVTTSPMVMGLLGNLDLVGLWSFALVGIGIKVMGRGNSSSAWVGGGVVFLCILALTIIPAALA